MIPQILYENGPFWVSRTASPASYTVYQSGATHSLPDSSYSLTDEGLSLAAARCNYLAKAIKPDALADRFARLEKSLRDA